MARPVLGIRKAVIGVVGVGIGARKFGECVLFRHDEVAGVFSVATDDTLLEAGGEVGFHDITGAYAVRAVGDGFEGVAVGCCGGEGREVEDGEEGEEE